MTDNDNDHNENEFEGPSKSQLKREADAVQKLGEQLVALDENTLNTFALPDSLLDAIRLARKIKQHGGRKRQLQYIGKLMRSIDTGAIEARFEQLNQQSRKQNLIFHRIEQWRDKLLADDQALAELINEHPELDRQHLRQLIRNARKEQEKNQPPKSARNLFRYLRDLISETDS